MPHEAGEFAVQSISLVMLTPSYVIPLTCALCCSGSQLKNEFYVCITVVCIVLCTTKFSETCLVVLDSLKLLKVFPLAHAQ